MVVAQPSPEHLAEARTYWAAYTVARLDRVGKDHVLERDSLGPCLAYLGIAEPIASGGCFLNGEAGEVVDAEIVEYVVLAEIHEWRIPENAAVTAGPEMEPTSDFAENHMGFLPDQDSLLLAKDLEIFPSGLSACYPEGRLA